MKKSTRKLIVFGAIAFIASMTSRKTGGGYGCDYTEAKTPSKIDRTIKVGERNSTHNYQIVRNVSE
jgi:hypothetical protein